MYIRYRSYKLPESVAPAPWGENFVVTVGVSYLAGSLGGSIIGVYDGLVRASSIPITKLKVNAVLNAMGKRGSKSANAFGSLALMYSGVSWGLNYSEYFTTAQDPKLHAAVSAGITGALYRLPSIL